MSLFEKIIIPFIAPELKKLDFTNSVGFKDCYTYDPDNPTGNNEFYIMFDDDSDERIKNGSYKTYTNFQKDMYVSSIILNQLHKSLSTQGIDENSSYYIKQFLLDAFFLKAFGYDYDALKKSTYSNTVTEGVKYDEFGNPYIDDGGGGYDPNAVLSSSDASPF